MPEVRCPICDQPFEYDTAPSRPFCSARCRQIDLGRWLDENYSVPLDGDDEDFDELEGINR